jgi:hypothetical protein
MLTRLSIKALYPLALAEGEGVGTAYEYYAKRLVLAGWVDSPGRMLIAGLPEKYGASLDFLLLGSELQANLVIADERPDAIEKVKAALAAAQAQGLLVGAEPAYALTGDLTALDGVDGPFDLCISSEVLQRLPPGGRAAYWRRLGELAPAVALFTPNGDNAAHATLSGLDSIRLDEVRALVQNAPGARVGYIDMPPFPPGITRSGEQREQASSGLVEGVAMWGLGIYARLEKVFPTALRRRQSHIVYALAREGQA